MAWKEGKGRKERGKERRKERKGKEKGKGKDERTKRTPPFLGPYHVGVGARGTDAYDMCVFMCLHNIISAEPGAEVSKEKNI